MEKFSKKILRLIASGTALALFAISLSSEACLAQQDELQITYSRNLEFRQLIPGVKKSVTETSPDAGKIIIRNPGGRRMVGLSFNLPGGISSGADFAPVVFSATYSVNPNDNQPGIPFNPYSGTTLTFDDKTKEYYIRIGGTVNTRTVQGAGEYNTPVIIILTNLNNLNE